jgi:hypothetical protein
MKKTSALLGLLLPLVLAGLASAKPVDQPRMEAARANLQSARSELQLATDNKGGHKKKAINLINQAIAAVNKGIAFDRRNNHASATAKSPASFDQPHMTRALDHLKDAKSNLERATTDKGGFRARAITLVNQSMDQIRLGIAAASE